MHCHGRFTITSGEFVDNRDGNLADFREGIIATFRFRNTSFQAFNVGRSDNNFADFTRRITRVLGTLAIFYVIAVERIRARGIRTDIRRFDWRLFEFNFQSSNTGGFNLFRSDLDLWIRGSKEGLLSKHATKGQVQCCRDNNTSLWK